MRSESAENPSLPPELANAVTDRTAPIAAMPSPENRPFSCEIIAKPQLMLVMNMNQMAHHSLDRSKYE